MARPKILVIRGGALGDFIVTLPAIGLLREQFAHCHLEVLGYRQFAALAQQCGPREGSTYADATRSIEYGPLAAFFARNAQLPPELVDYFASFQQVISWLFDPDGIFEANIRRAGVKNFLSGYVRIGPGQSASRQLARPLEGLALFLENGTVTLVPDASSQQEAKVWLAEKKLSSQWVALHPGSGSPTKNWPLERWINLAKQIQATGRRILLIQGEADEGVSKVIAGLPDAIVAEQLALPLLAGILQHCEFYVGHDTGISHLAAALGCPVTLLFGATDPAVWAPEGTHVQWICAPEGQLELLEEARVYAHLALK